MPRRLIAIINASAGADSKQAIAERLSEVFRSDGIEARVVLAHSGAEVATMARAAVRERPDIVVAGGGDGTINAVASEVVGTNIALGVLPLGTLNHFAKALHLPLDVEEAARIVIEGNAVAVDVGEVNGRIFLNNSSLGLYPRLVRHRDKQQVQLGRGKWTAAAWAALTLLRRHGFLRVRLSVNGEEIERRTAIIFIGNNAYQMNGFSVGERERLDAGLLSLYLPHRGGRSGLSLLAVRAIFGCLRESQDFDELFATAIGIETHHKRLLVANDGEVEAMDAPLRYRIRPCALRVICPRAVPVAGPD
ncbi:MAG: diacylglycerol kinase family protein [Dokdonella sp.]